MTVEILIADERAEEYAAALSDFDGPVRWRVEAGASDGAAAHCHVILGSPDRVAALHGNAPSLQWVQSTWAGVDQLTRHPPPCDYVLTGVKGVFGGLMAEYVLCYLLMHERHVPQRWASQRARRWDQTAPGTLKGKTLCIVGLGDIGRAIAACCSALGMRVIGVNRSGQPAGEHRTVSLDRLGNVVGESDYVVSVLPETPATRQLFDAALFASFKPGAFFINIGRGSAVDSQALQNGITSGRVAGAALDVFETEPLPADSTLWETPGVWITCHTAAPSFVEPVAALFRRNLARFLSGQKLHHVVDIERGY